MKTKTYFTVFLALSLFILFCSSCSQKEKKSETATPIENTLKSVSLVYDSLRAEPSEMLSIFEQINSLIDSIGYPGAGYKFWIVQGDSTKGFRFMVEGSWPDKAVYDSIHNNKILKSRSESLGKKFWKGKKTISYNRYTLVK